MKLLAVETATSLLSVAVMDDDQVLARSDMPAEGAHGRLLVPTIDQLLTTTKLGLSDLSLLGVSIGPGSFTGLRVGLSTLMGFRTAMGLPIVGVPTLEALAWNLRGESRPLCAMLKARTGELYWATYQWRPTGELLRLCEDRAGTWAAWVNSLTGPTVMVGEGWQVHREDLRNIGRDRAAWMFEGPAGAMAASADSVGMIARAKWAKGEVAQPGMAPHYVQRAEAEVKWAAKTMANSER
jgi:tRNA threonylcarbamoyladenosine biosynthesis protein TsaB